MAEHLFELRSLFRAIESERVRIGLTWSALSRDVGVAVSTIRRFEGADDAEADGVLALVRWLGVAPEEFVIGNAVPGKQLVAVGSGVVRVDMMLVAAMEGAARGARGRSRTTIQRLAFVAQRAGQPIASLTRLSDA